MSQQQAGVRFGCANLPLIALTCEISTFALRNLHVIAILEETQVPGLF